MTHAHYPNLLIVQYSPINTKFTVSKDIMSFHAFLFRHPKYIAPEVYLSGRCTKSGPKVDMWSLGIIILELALRKQLWNDLKLAQCMRKVLSLLHVQVSVLERLARELGCWDHCQVMCLYTKLLVFK
jgi:serine/threonine protein kinase